LKCFNQRAHFRFNEGGLELSKRMADDDAKPHRGGLLEVGVTSRPLGHSLLNQGKAFTEPVPPSACKCVSVGSLF